MIFDKYYRCKTCKKRICKVSEKTDLKLYQHLAYSHPTILERSKNEFISTICDENFYIGDKNGK